MPKPSYNRSRKPASAQSGGGGGDGGRRGGGGSRAALVPLEGPLHSNAWITAQYPVRQINSEWIANPKAPLSNYLFHNGMSAGGLSAGSNAFKTQQGVVQGMQVYRCVERVANEGRRRTALG